MASSKMVEKASEEWDKKEETTSALILAARMWKRGELEGAEVNHEEADACIDYLMTFPHSDLDGAATNSMLPTLLMNNIGTHFDIVASHRKWVKKIFELLKIAKVLYKPWELSKKIDKHDLSKYGPDEALGYSIMFGTNRKFRKLEGEDKKIWEDALQHHYRHNPHHPQYFLGFSMAYEDLQESLIDMLACRIERDFHGFVEIEPKMLVDIPEYYLTRYKDHEQHLAGCILDSWGKSLYTMIKYPFTTQLKQLIEWEKGSKIKIVSKLYG